MNLAVPETSPQRQASGQAATKPAKLTAAWTSLVRFISGAHALALADQAVVSSTSFLTTVFLARWSGSTTLGVYAVAVSVLASILAVQESLILLPFSIQQHRSTASPVEHAGAALAVSGLLSGSTMALLAIGAIGLSGWGSRPEIMAMTWAMAGVVPFAMMREFARRVAFAHLQMAQALLLDIAVAGIQLAALAWLGWNGLTSAVTGFGAIAVACGLAGIGWLYLARHQLSFRASHVKTTIKQSWALGKWLLAGRLTVQVQGYVCYWMALAVAGASVTGVYAACMSIVSFANPLIFGVANILTPRSVLAWKNGGGAGLRRQAIRDSLFLGAIMASFCVAVLLAGDYLMHALYKSKEFEGHTGALTLLAAAMLASAVGMPASNALASMERPRAIVVIGIMTVVITVPLVGWLMTEWGLLGAACGLLAGNVIGACGRWMAFLALVPRDGDPSALDRVLKEFTGSSAGEHWKASRMGEGDHAVVHLIQSQDQQPIWRDHRSLVVKLYKREAALDLQMVAAQFDSLAKLHAALDGRTLHGWSIATPRPLYLCKSAPALVMTTVPGQHIDFYPGTEEGAPERLAAAARAFTAVLEEGWSRGHVHGDLGLRNVLFDFRRNIVSFIDPGTLESCPVCNSAEQSTRPAALDLAHLLCEVATDVTDIMGNSAARVRRQIFVESALELFFERLRFSEARRQVSDEIWACSEAHLAQTLDLSWSPRGLWHRFIERVAVHRIRMMLDNVMADLEMRGSGSGTGRMSDAPCIPAHE